MGKESDENILFWRDDLVFPSKQMESNVWSAPSIHRKKLQKKKKKKKRDLTIAAEALLSQMEEELRKCKLAKLTPRVASVPVLEKITSPLSGPTPEVYNA